MRQARLVKLIAAQCAFKAKIVAGDEREAFERADARSRRILNFGHTIGHALETVTRYRRFRHGEAVGGGQRDGGWAGEGRPDGGHALAILPGLTHYNVGVSPLFAAVTLSFLDA